MKREEFLRIVRKQIRFVFDRDEIENELKQHLADSIEDLMEEGLSREESEYLAVEQMGNPVEVGKLLNEEHSPILGYLLGTSKVFLCLLIFYIAWPVLLASYNLIMTLKPFECRHSVETYTVNLDMDLPTHRVKIDNICLNENGQYCLTFRAWTKMDYSRAGWSNQFFFLKNKDGMDLGGGTYTGNFIVSYGSKDFEWPEDSVLHIVGVDSEVIELDLTEYCDEKR